MPTKGKAKALLTVIPREKSTECGPGCQEMLNDSLTSRCDAVK